VVLSDGRHGDDGIKAWLSAYHHPVLESPISCFDPAPNLAKSAPLLPPSRSSQLTNQPRLVTTKFQWWTQFGFQRAGAIIAAVNLDFHTTRPSELTLLTGLTTPNLPLSLLHECEHDVWCLANWVRVCTEGVNGQLPNLDLINTVVRNARRSSCSIQIPKVRFMGSACLLWQSSNPLRVLGVEHRPQHAGQATSNTD